ncbi:MAG: glycoside hydrolase, partial [Bacteroidaceae bacterium]|nr:glycoside hydrolase [Bacteroidaceae bacterium]
MKHLFTALALVAVIPVAGQGLKSGPYELPYKNTYVKNIFVAENEFRNQKPTTLTPGTFEEAKNILPLPIWKGHEKEIEMYWHAWKIAIGNIKQPQEGSGFVSP